MYILHKFSYGLLTNKTKMVTQNQIVYPPYVVRLKCR